MRVLKEGRSHEQPVQASTTQDEFDELCQEHYLYVYRLISKIILNEDTAKELTQDTFMNAAKQFQRFRGDASFRTWVCRIAVNQANGYLRKQYTVRKHQDELHIQSELSPHPAGPRDSLFYKEDLEQVTTAMAKLEPDLRMALVLTVIEGVDPSEAARMQGCSRATLYWRVHQARKLLKEALHHVD